MKVWDMHCDTLAELRYAQQAGKPKSFLHNDLMMDLERMKQGDYLLQCMACFVHLEPEREKSPLLACLEEIDIFYRLLEQYPDDLMQVRTAADIQTLLTSGKRGMMLTVEEGGACLDSLGALRDLYRLGVRMMTLTWNFKNGLAEPNIVPGTDDMWPRPANTTGGLTEKGLEFVEEMQRLQELQAANFAITELGLYLDTHADDAEAVQLFNQYVEQYEMLRQQAEDSGMANTLYKTLTPYMVTDLSGKDVSTLLETSRSYTFQGVMSPEGTVNSEGKLVEFYVDEASLRSLVLSLYYEAQ